MGANTARNLRTNVRHRLRPGQRTRELMRRNHREHNTSRRHVLQKRSPEIEATQIALLLVVSVVAVSLMHLWSIFSENDFGSLNETALTQKANTFDRTSSAAVIVNAPSKPQTNNPGAALVNTAKNQTEKTPVVEAPLNNDKAGISKSPLAIKAPFAIPAVRSILLAAYASEQSTKHELLAPNEKLYAGEITRSERSVAEAAEKIGLSYNIIDDVVDLFSDRIQFRQDLQIGDRFALVISDKTQKGNGSQIVAAAFSIGKKRYEAVRFLSADGKAHYVDGSGMILGNTFLRYPLKFTRISSYFANARFHPVLKTHRPHNGVDFAAPKGTPVRTIADGKVVFAGRNGGAGLMVKIQHNSRYASAYLHLSKIDKSVKKGATVHRGQLIGAVGSTGLATGPHLHFSFYDNGKYVNPLMIKLPTLAADPKDRGVNIDKSYLNRMLRLVRHYTGSSDPKLQLATADSKTEKS